MDLEQLAQSTCPTITVSAAAGVLGVDPRTVMRGVDEGTIPAIRLGRRVVIPRVPLLRMLTGEPASAEVTA